MKIYEFFSDWCLAGKGYQEFYQKVSGEGTEYVRVPDPNALRVVLENGKLSVQWNKESRTADMVVLAPAIVPAAGSEKLAAQFGLTLDKNGFFTAENERISPAATTVRGVYIAGCAAGPKDVPQSALQGQAAAGLALSSLVPGEKMELETATSCVDENLCSGCRTCLGLCPYQAISFDETKRTAAVNQILCKGCGVCVSGCPSGALENKHFSNKQINSEIEGALP